jgi:CxxC-x17-CxxC domain-containing protein
MNASLVHVLLDTSMNISSKGVSEINMSDQNLTCVDCGKQFTFTETEQEFYQSKGFTTPGRCPDCRAARKAARNSGSSYSGSSYVSGERQMYPAVCAQCGKATQVPFQPRGDRPVYCSDCYRARQGGNSYDGSSGGSRSRSGRRYWIQPAPSSLTSERPGFHVKPGLFCAPAGTWTGQ